MKELVRFQEMIEGMSMDSEGNITIFINEEDLVGIIGELGKLLDEE